MITSVHRRCRYRNTYPRLRVYHSLEWNHDPVDILDRTRYHLLQTRWRYFWSFSKRRVLLIILAVLTCQLTGRMLFISHLWNLQAQANVWDVSNSTPSRTLLLAILTSDAAALPDGLNRAVNTPFTCLVYLQTNGLHQTLLSNLGLNTSVTLEKRSI